nr:DNA-directed DNA polymerase [Tanacetum cinerariifolium]
MRTRSSSNLVGETSTNPKCRNRRCSKQRIKPFSLEETLVVTMADQRTMVELLQAPTEGYRDAIFIPVILAEKYELKHGLLNLVTSKQFYEFENEDPHAHIRWFNKITSRLSIEISQLTEQTGSHKSEYEWSFFIYPSFPEIVALADAVKAILREKYSPPTSVKVVEEICVTCGGPHPYHQCLATDGNVFLKYRDNIQGYVSAAAQTQVVPSNELSNYKKMNDANMKALQNQISNVKNELRNEMQTSIQTSMNTIANPRGDLKAITTRSGVSYDGPPIPPFFLLFPRWWNGYPIKLHFDLSFADALLHMPKFATMFKSLLNNKEKLFDLVTNSVNENCSAVILKKLPEKLGDPGKFLILCDFLELVECLALADLGARNNLIPLSIWEKLSLPKLTPTQMILEFADRSTNRPAGIAEDVFVKVGKFHFSTDYIVVDYVVDPRVPLILERPFLRTRRALIDVYGEELTLRVDDEAITFKGDILFLEKLINDDPSSPLPLKELNLEELKTVKSSIDDPPDLEVKDLPSHLEYAFLEGTNKLPVIIAKNLKEDEKDDSKPAIQHQRRVNPKIHEVIKKEVIKLLDAGLIYPISDSPWVSHVHYVPKKGGMTVVTNEDNELIRTRCMMAIFHNMIEETMEVFMDDFSIFEDSFSSCLTYLDKMLKWYEDTNLVLNWEKFHFMVKEGIVIGHKILKFRIEVDKAMTAGDHRKVQMNELNELRDQAYKNSLSYKEKTKKIHDFKIKNRVFNVGDRVLLFNSRLKIFSSKLKTRWTRPFTVSQVFPYGTVELSLTNGTNFKVNGHRLKHYFGGDIPPMVVPDLQTFPMDN